jgi:hypothetical protein
MPNFTKIVSNEILGKIDRTFKIWPSNVFSWLFVITIILENSIVCQHLY